MKQKFHERHVPFTLSLESIKMPNNLPNIGHHALKHQ
jgi:hypothetical protein